MATSTKADTAPMKLNLDAAIRHLLTATPQRAISDIKRQLIPLLMAKADDKGNSSEWAIRYLTEQERRLAADCPWPFSAGVADATYPPNTTPIQRKALHKSAQVYLWNLLNNTFMAIPAVQYILTDPNYQCLNYAHRDELTDEPTPIGTLLWVAIEQHYMSKDDFETLNYMRSYRAMLQSVEALKSFKPEHVQIFYDWIDQCTITENIVKDFADDTRCNSANFNDLKSHLTKLHASAANRGHQGINFDYATIYDNPRFNTAGGPDYMNIGAMLSELRSAVRKQAASTTDSSMKSVSVMNVNSTDHCTYCGGKGHTRSNCKKLKAYQQGMHVHQLHTRSGPPNFKRAYNKPNFNPHQPTKRRQPSQLGFHRFKPPTKFRGPQYQHKSPRFDHKHYTEPYNKTNNYHQRRGRTSPPPYQHPRSVRFNDQQRPVPAFVAAPPRPLPRDPPPRAGFERAGFEAPTLPANDNLLNGAATTHHVFRVGVVDDDLYHKTSLAPIGIQPTPSAKGITPAPNADCDPISDNEDDDNRLPPKKRLALHDDNDKPVSTPKNHDEKPQYIPVDCAHLSDDNGNKDHDDRYPEDEVFGDSSGDDADDLDTNNDNDSTSASEDDSADANDNNNDGNSDSADDSADADDNDNDHGDDGSPSAEAIDAINIDDDIFESAKISHNICATAQYIADLEEHNKILEAEINDYRELNTMFDTINQDAHKYILSLKTDIKHLETIQLDLAADLASYRAEVRRLENCLYNNNLQHLISGTSPSDDDASDHPETESLFRHILSQARTDNTIIVPADASLPSPSDDNSASDNSVNDNSVNDNQSPSSDSGSSGSL